jgi:hypothetical protein
MKREDIGEAEVYLFNPRRENFPINDPNASKEQIEWEYVAFYKRLLKKGEELDER